MRKAIIYEKPYFPTSNILEILGKLLLRPDEIKHYHKRSNIFYNVEGPLASIAYAEMSKDAPEALLQRWQKLVAEHDEEKVNEQTN